MKKKSKVSNTTVKVHNDDMTITSVPVDEWKKQLDEMIPLRNDVKSEWNSEGSGDDIHKMDAWCEKQIKKLPNLVYIKGDAYPYKGYGHIDTLLRKYSAEFVKYLVKIYPNKKKIGRDFTAKERDECLIEDLYDSVAFNIYKLRIDPRSIAVIPEDIEKKSLWSKISEKGYDKN